ncbi:helix-turn-helix domain-containing protein [Leucobacter luti]|uniref:Helix-turn-helix protein n=1 Tax=Leucobacter luti TaxID=340320 RepID=A0A4V6MD04_9MICO|nr:helix-turn-helix transcriptional regulator [Leucobacter luti]RZT66379.1 helix-turn-helix protein [Leucobacter luti]
MEDSALRKQFGAALRQYRADERITQEELARRLSLTPRYTAGLERSEHNISLDTIDGMAEKLGLVFRLVARARSSASNIEPRPDAPTAQASK